MGYIYRDYIQFKSEMNCRTLSYIPSVLFFSNKNTRIIIHSLCPRDLYTGNVLYSRQWTMEHIVPKSMISNKSKKNDLHNLSGVDYSLNNRRGNKKFGDGMIQYNIYDECKISIDLFSPVEGKGESARACAYMIESYGSLIDRDNVIDEDTMIRWNYENPPNDSEKRKNEIIYNIQGTYNRFTDDYKLLQ